LSDAAAVAVARLTTLRGMSDVTIMHNQQCSTSRAAMERIGEAHVEADVVDYLRKPLDAAALVGLTEADVETREQVVAVLVEHPRLMQRPVVVKGDRAIIGRPKERVAAFLAD